MNINELRQLAGLPVVEGQKPYVSSADNEAYVLDSNGKTVKTFTRKEHGADYIRKASAYLDKHYDTLREGEGEAQKVAVGHVDNEREMIMKDLYLIGHYAVELHKMLRDLPDSDFPHWWQSKITKSLEYIDNAKHYLEAELNTQTDTQVSPEVTDDIDPSGVSS